ncbi:TonB-dependent copper receptor [Acinetobacter soli]|uniref:TonB-dependent copper receptor n=1 Tax=Acinetobacter soli TaxID=487316 RepID=UPI001ABC53E9|nr:TonB-dependent copper receptor [Acinetobacter soli]MBO3640974.1 TonB-dependent copper receptor [Acinetobacter soli]WEI09796.1 TonB-dependent copper receptor [Acinetobacter soli]WOQ36566.1 TonB-dependent copper receptor [Acinetobacter soli]
MTQPQFLLQPITAAMLLATTTAFAETQSATDTTQMPPIVVTAQETTRSNGLIVQADPKQPIQPVPATDGADYLQSILGFNAIKNGGTNGDVTFRGMFGSRIKMLTDGTENLGACPARMDSPTSYINPESYDRITVIKGPQTVLYATPGSAATVLFEREPEQLSADKPYRGQASVLIGSFGRLDHNIEAAVGDESKYARLNATRSVAGNYQDGNGKTVQSQWERWSTDLALGWKPTQDTWLELRGGASDGESAYAGRTMDGTQFRRESLGLHAEQKNITDVIKKVEAQIDYSYNDHVMDNFKLRTPPMMPMAMEVTRRTINARTAVTTEWGNFSAISGVDSQHNQHAGNMYMRDANPIPPLKRDLEYQSYGAFTEWTYTLSPETKWVAGGRIDQVKVNHAANDQQRKDTNPSAFVRIEHALPEHGLKTYAGIGYVERSPDYWEISRVSKGLLNYLDTEKTTQLDLGFEFEQGALTSWASAYAGLIDDFILVPYQSNPNGSVSILPARSIDATIAGAEAGIGYHLTDHLQTDLSAMYAWGKNTSDGKPLPQIAPLEGRFNLRYVQDRYSLGLLWRAVAKQNRISLNEGNIVGYDIGKSKGFSTLAINAAYQYSPTLDFAVGIDNLLDKAYAEHLNKSGAALFGYAANEQFNNSGRNYWARVSMKF